AGLADGWKAGHAVPLSPGTEKALAERLPKLSAAGKGSLFRLMAALGNKSLQKYAAGIVASLLEAVGNGDAEAARQSVELAPNDAKVAATLLDAITPRSSPELVAGLLDALAASRAAGVGPGLVGKLAAATPATKAAAVRALLGRAEWSADLLDAVEKGTLRLDELSLDHKQALATHPSRSVRDRAKAVLAKGGDLPSADRQKVIDALLPLLKRAGDVEKGKLAFKNQCAKCHKHTGDGADIGPDLTGMATHPKLELLTHIIDPSRSVEGNFRVWTVVTNRGVSYTGMLASETKTTVEIIDAEAKKTVVRRDRIERLEASAKSLMPEGFEKQMKEPELVDLLEFLTHRGKYLPLPLDRVATAVSTQGMFFAKESPVERMVFPDWKPKAVGEVPFVLVDPQGEAKRNVVLLYGPQGTAAPTMPRSVRLPCGTAAKAVHLLGGVAGWASPGGRRGSVSMTVRLHYADGKTEDHPLRNGEHVADYIRRVDVPGSTFAFDLRGKQVRYLAVTPARGEVIKEIEFVKGPDGTAPIVVAVTVEGR
ncbi:MAG: c-type cytochrome, partial [Gemmataceae bacterium]